MYDVFTVAHVFPNAANAHCMLCGLSAKDYLAESFHKSCPR